jgi:hypothetical protein
MIEEHDMTDTKYDSGRRDGHPRASVSDDRLDKVTLMRGASR